MSSSLLDPIWEGIPMDIMLELENGLQNTTFSSVNVAPAEFWTDDALPINWNDDNLGLRQSLGVQNPEPLPMDIAVKEEPKTPEYVFNPVKEEDVETDEEKPLHLIEHSGVLGEMFKNQNRFEKLLQEVIAKQKKVTLSNRDDITTLQQKSFNLHQQITTQIKELDALSKKIVFSSDDLNRFVIMKQSLSVQQHRTELLKTELQHIVSEDEISTFALTIADQGGPQIVFKGRALEYLFCVKLITGAKTKLDQISSVIASVAEEEILKGQKGLTNEECEFDSRKNATFESLKVTVSTRMNPVHLKFSCKVHDRNGSANLKSTYTSPIIAITNESQWTEAAGKLLLMEAFAGQTTVTWAQYINTLNQHLLRSTGQKLSEIVRIFTAKELEYLKERFFPKDRVSIDEAKKCWGWLGDVLNTIRFKRHIKNLWFYGLVYGLISKKESMRILGNEPSGTFLIRFSDSSAGSLAVAYATDEANNRIKHYMIKPEDISVNKSLPEFLREKKPFKTIVMLKENGQSSKLDKESAFAEFFKTPPKNKPKQAPDKSGYVQNLDLET